MPITALGDNYNKESKGTLWEHVFNIDHLQKNRQRKQNSINTNNEKNRITLNYGISSDGHMVSVLFSARTIERLPETNDNEQYVPNSVDISNWKRGFRDLVTTVDASHENIINKQTTKEHTFSISNGDYKTITQRVCMKVH
ncbi:hypothetical protein RMATCC62417_12705 [Rhizopus microsporus]|nr:hypothetical protein RMATCC62417_12705 [Rhizopus microsporus]